MTREEAYDKLGILPCYDESACGSCEDCDFQKAIDIARGCMRVCGNCKHHNDELYCTNCYGDHSLFEGE